MSRAASTGGALEQATNLANLPFVFKHIAIMPDAHQGYGMPIGGVMATKDVVIPNAVGVDIGCGMCAIKTSISDIDIDNLKTIMSLVRKTVPVCFAHQQKEQDESLMPYGIDFEDDRYPIVKREYPSALKQLGTLGGGNHFIEFQKGSDGFIWIMIHSGSRNIGYQVANHYNKLAISLNEKWHSKVPKEWQLAFLPIDSKEGQAYLEEMQYCVNFALANRSLMMDRIKAAFSETIENIEFGDMINIAHNYATIEHHFGKNVMIHRKGATRAYTNDIGIIPGSQGTKSYIVKGLGNTESFKSCSHGAGRVMGRKQAQRELSLKDEIKKRVKTSIGHIQNFRV